MAICDQLALYADAVCGTIDVADWENYAERMREHFASDGTKARLQMDACSGTIENNALRQVLRCFPSGQHKGWSACRLRPISEPLAVRLKQCDQSRYVLLYLHLWSGLENFGMNSQASLTQLQCL